VRGWSGIYKSHLFCSSVCGFDHLIAFASVRRERIARYQAGWTAITWIVEDRWFEFRAVGKAYDDGFNAAGAEAAFYEYLTDAFDVPHSFFECDIGTTDEEFRVAVWAEFWRCVANAILVHGFNLASKLIFWNTNFPDMAWFTRNGLTFSIWLDLHEKAELSRYGVVYTKWLNFLDMAGFTRLTRKPLFSRALARDEAAAEPQGFVGA
jgi:hypothetical protein